MARPGDVIDNGRIRLEFRETAGSTGGERLVMAATYRPSPDRPPLHFHPKQTERFEMLSGSLSFSLDGREERVAAGEDVIVDPRVVHQVWNSGQDEAQVVWTVQPALQTERMFETLYGLARDGKTDETGRPGLLQVAVIAREYRNEMVLASPPPIVQTCVFCLLAPIARRLGYRASYPRYSPD